MKTSRTLKAPEEVRRPADTIKASGYIAELDGLRAFAIIPVIFFHQHIRGFSLGWAGVVLFFTISGFLITGILLDAKSKPHYFRNFYVRRALRIFPIYYLSLLGVVLLAWWRGSPLQDLPFYAAYLQNYVLGVTEFHAKFPGEFAHTWSLAVEEQFYFLWPLTVLILSRRAMVILCLSLIVLAPPARIAVIVETGNPMLVYTPLVCVADSLACGAMMAVLLRSGVPVERIYAIASIVVVVAGAMLLLLVWRFGISNYWSPDGYLASLNANVALHSLMSILFASLIACVVIAGSSVLRNGVLGHIGKISYGLYLYHLPILLAFGAVHPPSKIGRWSLWAVEWCAIYAVALASWWLVEKRCLALKRRFSSSSF